MTETSTILWDLLEVLLDELPDAIFLAEVIKYERELLRLNEYLDQIERATVNVKARDTDDSDRTNPFKPTCNEQPAAMLTEAAWRPNDVRPDAERSDAPRDESAIPGTLRSDAPNKSNATSFASPLLPGVSCDPIKEKSCQSTETLSETRLCLETDVQTAALRDTDVDSEIQGYGSAFDFKSVPAFFNTSIAIVNAFRTDKWSTPKSTIDASDIVLSDTDVDSENQGYGAAFGSKPVPASVNTSAAHTSGVDQLPNPKFLINASDAALRDGADHNYDTSNTMLCQKRMIRDEDDSFKVLRSENDSFQKMSYADKILIDNYEKSLHNSTDTQFNKYTVHGSSDEFGVSYDAGILAVSSKGDLVSKVSDLFSCEGYNICSKFPQCAYREPQPMH